MDKNQRLEAFKEAEAKISAYKKILGGASSRKVEILKSMELDDIWQEDWYDIKTKIEKLVEDKVLTKDQGKVEKRLAMIETGKAYREIDQSAHLTSYIQELNKQIRVIKESITGFYQDRA